MSADLRDLYLGPIKAAANLGTRTHATAIWADADGALVLSCLTCRDEHRINKPLDPDRVVKAVTAFRGLHSECGVTR